MENKKCYSLNLATFCIHNGHVSYEILKDDEGKVFVEFRDDISETKKLYREDEKLHSYLSCFKDLKKKINKIKFA